MAGAGQGTPLQLAHSSNHVNLGHFGTATYNSGQRSWSFLRQSPSKSSADDVPFRLVRDPVQITQDVVSSTAFDTASVKPAVISLLKSIPEAAPAAVQQAHLFTPGSERQKEQRAQSHLAFGSALLLGANGLQSGFLSTPIAAIVTASEPEKLSFRLLESETAQVDLDLEDLLKVRLPSIQDQESASWTTAGDAIEQIQFSDPLSNQGAAWLAVRRRSSIDIFHPLFHRTETDNLMQHRSNSSLNPNHIANIPCLHTGGLPIAHVAFHPQTPRDLAVVDVGGNWSVWRIKGIRSRTVRVLYRVQLLVQGSIVAQPRTLEQFDGWHRVLWLSSGRGEIDRLSVCNRRSIALWDLRGDKLLEVDARVGLRSGGWILDIAATSPNDSFFVLTASAIFSVTAGGGDDILGSAHDDLAVLAYWNHFRASDNQSLQLEALQYLDAETASPHQHHVSGRLLKLFIQNQDGNIIEMLYSFQQPKIGGHQPRHAVPLPKQHLLQHRSAYRVTQDEGYDSMDDFVVPDLRPDPSADQGRTDPDLLVTRVLEMTLDRKSEDSNPHLRNLERTYDLLLQDNASRDAKARTALSKYMEDVERMVEETDHEQPRSLLVLELATTLPHIAEIEDDSRTLATWVQELTDTQSPRVSSNTGPKLLIDVYDELVAWWMQGLTSRVSDRARVRRERLLRQIALEAFLASITFESLLSMGGQTSQHKPGATAIASPTRAGGMHGSSMLIEHHSVETENSQTEAQPPILRSYTTYKGVDGSATVVNDMLAHLPVSADTDADPDSYSHNDIELDLALMRNEMANQELDLRSRRKAEKLARARKRQFEKQTQMQMSAMEQKATVPSVMSSQLPVRDVQSSQTRALDSSQPGPDSVPQVSMSQPERGAYGVRIGKKAKAKSKLNRQKGF